MSNELNLKSKNYEFIPKDIDALSSIASKKISLLDKQKMLIKAGYVGCIIEAVNSNENLQRMALRQDYAYIKLISNPTDDIEKYSNLQSKVQEKKCYERKKREDGYYSWGYEHSWYRTCNFNRPSKGGNSNTSTESYSGSRGSSGGGGHYIIQTVRVPGGNGRTGQTRVWVNH